MFVTNVSGDGKVFFKENPPKKVHQQFYRNKLSKAW